MSEKEIKELSDDRNWTKVPGTEIGV